MHPLAATDPSAQTRFAITEEIEPQLMPHGAFTDPRAWDAEQDAVFRASWVNIGFAGDLARTGDARTFDFLGEPLLMVRDRHGAVRVFHNVCRHRGHLLETRPTAQLNHIACAYHAWNYDLDGSFRGAPCWDGKDRQPPSAEAKAHLGLREVRSATWCDSVFINLDGQAEPFEAFIAPLAQRWAPYRFEQFRLCSSTTAEAMGNWKLAVENFLDSYHFPVIHKEFGGYDVMRRLYNLRVSDDVFGYHMPTGEADKPKAGAPLKMLDLPERLQPAQDILYLYPNTLLILTSTWLQVMALLPAGAGHTHERIGLYVVQDDGHDPALAKTVADFIRAELLINSQDLPVLAALQRGLRSPAAGGGQYVRYWDENPRALHARLLKAVDYAAVLSSRGSA
jgi:choline monooxygenase